jgi:hypothetical protein
VSLCSGVDDLVDGLHGEVEGHELALFQVRHPFQLLASRFAYDGVKSSKSSSNSKTSETRLGDGAVNDPLLAEAVEQTLGDFVSAVALAPCSQSQRQPVRGLALAFIISPRHIFRFLDMKLYLG